jgi:hypothetical protein
MLRAYGKLVTAQLPGSTRLLQLHLISTPVPLLDATSADCQGFRRGTSIESELAQCLQDLGVDPD